MPVPTALGSDTLPLRRRTKELLASAKGNLTYDQAIAELLELTPPEILRARLELQQAAESARVREMMRASASGAPTRSPEKQVLIARLAADRWSRWLAEGRVTRLGPRRYRWNLRPREAGGARIARRPGRGLPP